MNAIFGIFNRNSMPVLPSVLKKMQTALCGASVCSLWSDGPIVLGQFTAERSITASYVHGMTPVDSSEPFKFIAIGRLDNAAEVADLLRIPQADRIGLSDFDIMRIAFGTWGEDCSMSMYGDWSFAAWHPAEKRLVLARDHHGNTALYYYLDHKVCAFATSRQALLALNLCPIELDELYLAQFLTSCFSYNDKRTLYSSIRRLPPAHYMSVTNDRCDIHRYWRLEDTSELNLPNRHDYVAVFRELFDEAVRCRLCSPGLIGISMSGGLDSGSVAALAARRLRGQGRRLPAFTAVPHHHPPNYIGYRFNNEFPMAQAIANQAGNIDLHPLASAAVSPIMAIRSVLELNCDPNHGACNLYWITDIRRTARAMGCTALMTGSMGNGGISWTGDIRSQTLSYRLSHLPWGEFFPTFCSMTKQRIKSVLPSGVRTTIQRYRMEQKEWWRTTAIHPNFARRIRLLELRLSEQNEQTTGSTRQQRCRVLMPGHSIAGAMASELGAAYGLSILDPTADARVLAFTFSVPDHIFIDPETGTDRWLIREAMKGYLPEEVRLNRKRGLQASDLVLRLRAFAGDVESALDEIGCGPAAAYVDVDHLRRVWQVILTEDTAKSFIMASNILCRGIMAGLFVNRFYA